MTSKLKALPLPRYVKPESLDIGDTIRVSYEEDDTGVIRTRQGVIAKREYQGSDRVLLTAQGGTLLVWNPHHKSPRITLLAKAEPPQPMLSLFEDENLTERIS